VNALKEITGNGQYCYLMALPAGQGLAQLMVMNSGPLPLERCFVIVHGNFPVKSAQDAESRMRPLDLRELGPVARGKDQGITTDNVLPATSYYIQIITRNDRFYETLTIHSDYPNPQKHEGYETIKIRDEKWRVVYSSP
jgi:hypothetical protein